jgi:ATP/maltotriose-dependent transcriptional regulator MalT
MSAEIVVHSRLIPPRLPRRWLRRSRLDQLLAAVADHPLALVVASAGYGKSSALASFAARGGWPTAWYSLGDGGEDPHTFLLHLIYALRMVAPQVGQRSLNLLASGISGPHAWRQVLDTLANDLVLTLDDETILVIDDFHAVDEYPAIRELLDGLIQRRLPRLHIIVATRRRPQLTCLPILAVRGELYEIGENDLAFTTEEIADLFADTYERPLHNNETQSLVEQTGGWAIALQLIWQSTQQTAAETPQQLIDIFPAQSLTEPTRRSASHEALFAYLAQDVLAHQPAEIQRFLLRSAVLNELCPADCDAILLETDSATQLRQLYQRGLFLTETGNRCYRFHPLFRSFLQTEAASKLDEWEALHRRAASYFRANGAGEKVLYHLLAINDVEAAALELKNWTQPWLDAGRFVTLIAWLDQLPAAMLNRYPILLIARGDATRLLSRFDQAHRAYADAATAALQLNDLNLGAQALIGQARIGLDTVQPALAEPFLRQALQLLPREHPLRAAIWQLRVEQRVNFGRADQAERLLRTVQRRYPDLPPISEQLRARILVRQGRLSEAWQILKAEYQSQTTDQERPAGVHRETSLQLAFVAAQLGLPEEGLRYAKHGLDDARRLGSPLTEALAYTRIGHTLQLLPQPNPTEIVQQYLQAIALSDSLGVARFKTEAYLGLALLYGFNGDLSAARAAHQEALAAVAASGDRWVHALIWVAQAAIEITCNSPEAAQTLDNAEQICRQLRDRYCTTLLALWRTIHAQRTGNTAQALKYAPQLIRHVQQHGYDSLVLNNTLFGPSDRMMLPAVLLAARAVEPTHQTAQRLLAHGYPAIASDDNPQNYHPGFTLRIQTFERLRVWRGLAEIEPREWQRKKAQQMLGLLITSRNRWLLRDQICDILWPGDSPSDAETQFKVTLNALNSALEPLRPPRTAPFYIRRQGGAYRFAPPDGVWIDVAAFEAHLLAATTRLAHGGEHEIALAQSELETAVALFQGDYLTDNLYEEWTRDERERLKARFVEGATQLAELYADQKRFVDAIRLCDLVLSHDRCWEDAYVLLMQLYARQGNRRQAIAAYERCVRHLNEQLGVEPLAATRKIYEAIRLS